MTNFVSTIVKILESPRELSLDKKTFIIKCRAQFPQGDRNQIIDLVFWGSLGKDFKTYYKRNDYILIEGYLSVQINKTLDLTNPKSERIKVTVLKIYPFLLTPTDFANRK